MIALYIADDDVFEIALRVFKYKKGKPVDDRFINRPKQMILFADMDELLMGQSILKTYHIDSTVKENE